MTLTPNSSPVRVLVVDDDAMSRDLLALLLDAEGYAVESADSGDAALTFLSQSPAPGIVLTDIKMPGTSGRPLANRLRRLCGPETLLLAMSGSGPSTEATRAYDGFLLKPFTMEEFAAAASSYIAQGNESEPAQIPQDAALNETIYSKLTASMQPDQLHQQGRFL